MNAALTHAVGDLPEHFCRLGDAFSRLPRFERVGIGEQFAENVEVLRLCQAVEVDSARRRRAGL